MKLLLLSLLALAPYAGAACFQRSSVFESVEAFVAAAKAFQPAGTKSDFSAMFTVNDRQGAEVITPVTATAVEAVEILWMNDPYALVYATAAPPTEATPSAVGVIFLLHRTGESWRIAQSRRFTSAGKYARISAALTCGSDTLPDSVSSSPIITIKANHGGRGYNFSVSGSFILRESRLERLDLE